ncbi:uncharacterized conserved protein [Longilinea arvoryzae]|uniref:Uncharacterized conserved protein n=1 Tax=Longilinea arvoryzae TaxID=360412 RepID=A0A0S7BCN2_9CHLR|nr:ACT domain-containing protein [Longilinea arvoryzae]GAP12528.1 uncharacterized conserved protein [Longilinea arvoryzae]
MTAITVLPERYSVCRLAADAEIPAWAMKGPFTSLTRTPDELSLVCSKANLPADLRCEPGWRILRLEGPFAFDQIGVLLGVLAPLAQAGVSVFTLSTYDTDYVFVKEALLARACAALKEAGHDLEPDYPQKVV